MSFHLLWKNKEKNSLVSPFHVLMCERKKKILVVERQADVNLIINSWRHIFFFTQQSLHPAEVSLRSCWPAGCISSVAVVGLSGRNWPLIAWSHSIVKHVSVMNQSPQVFHIHFPHTCSLPCWLLGAPVPLLARSSQLSFSCPPAGAEQWCHRLGVPINSSLTHNTHSQAHTWEMLYE